MGFWPIYKQHQAQQEAMEAMGEFGEMMGQMGQQMGGSMAGLSTISDRRLAAVRDRSFSSHSGA